MHQIKFVIPFLFCLFCAEEKTKEEWWHKKAGVMVEIQIERRGAEGHARDTTASFYSPPFGKNGL
jgi:hypothetical protein